MRLCRSRTLIIGIVLAGTILLLALLAPLLAPYGANDQDLSRTLLAPSADHWLGTDALGRDVLSRLLFAAQVDLRIAVLAAIAPFVLGVTIGLISGWQRGSTDWVLSRFTETMIAFPFYVLVIVLVFAIGAGEVGIYVAFAIVGWTGYARVMRAMTASIRERAWAEAARGAGISTPRILLRHVLPNVVPQALVLLTTEIVLILVALVTLGYLGLGIQPPTPDWGAMIADGQLTLGTAWWLSAAPGAAVVLTAIALALIGDGLGDTLRIEQADASSAPRSAPRASLSDSERARRDPGALSVVGLTLESSAGRELVQRLEFEAAGGSALGIVGASGSGKSLTLRAMLGLLPGGVHQVAGEMHMPGRAGMIFQDPASALDPLSTVGSHLREAILAADHRAPARGRRRSRAAMRARIRELLQLVRLDDVDRIRASYPHELSGGQQQRVVIAIALAGDPEVLLCDEPTTALDLTVQGEILALLDALRQSRGVTLVFVSHDLSVVAHVCDRVVVMSDGQVVEHGETVALLSDPQHPTTRELVAAVPSLRDVIEQAERPVENEPRREAEIPRAKNIGIEARHVSMRSGAMKILRDVELAVPAGSALGLIGASGSGKSSLARVLAGTVRAEGWVAIGDEVVTAERWRSSSCLRRVQVVPQHPGEALNPRHSVRRALTEVLRLVDRHDLEARARKLLLSVGLDESFLARVPARLSGGQRQRVAIARALAAEPEVLITDESTSALDVVRQRQIMELLQGLRREMGLTLICISHDLAVVASVCDEIAVMDAGEVQEHASLDDFFASPKSGAGKRLREAVLALEA